MGKLKSERQRQLFINMMDNIITQRPAISEHYDRFSEAINFAASNTLGYCGTSEGGESDQALIEDNVKKHGKYTTKQYSHMNEVN